MEIGKRMGAKRGNLTEAIKEAIEIWIKAYVLAKLKYSRKFNEYRTRLQKLSRCIKITRRCCFAYSVRYNQ
jgi:hypothetical protein